MIGYDLDGTICSSTPKRSKPFMHQNGKERKAYERKYEKHLANAKVVRRPDPKIPFVIITGRKEKYRPETLRWLKKHRIKPRGLFMLLGSRTRKNMINHKHDWCRLYKVARYYEDSANIARGLAKRGINVVRIKGKIRGKKK